MCNPSMRIVRSSPVRAALTLVVSGCIGGTGSGLTGIATDSLAVNASRPAPVLVFFSQPAGGNAGAIMPAVQVVAKDSLGSTDTTFASAVTLSLGSNSSGAALAGVTSVRAVRGIATFGNLRIDRAGNYTLRASASRATAVTSAPFTISTPTTP
jgi:hypothetical protein